MEAKQESRPTFTDILQTLECFLESTADYVDLTEYRCTDTAEHVNLTRLSSDTSRTSHVPALLNEYCIAGFT